MVILIWFKISERGYSMNLIIGLGNIGAKYQFTRHNVGFMVVDYLALNNSESFRENTKLKSLITKIRLNGEDTLLVKPTTYMNLSGEALRAVMDYYKIPIENTLVVYDDLSLDFGKIRFRPSGSDGGHNGIKSLISHAGTNKFSRVKIGVGPQMGLPSEVFVLQNFSKEQMDGLKSIITKVAESIEYYYQNGIEKTQNFYN